MEVVRNRADQQASKRGKAEGPSTYDVRKILGFFDPPPPLSAFGTDLQYRADGVDVAPEMERN